MIGGSRSLGNGKSTSSRNDKNDCPKLEVVIVRNEITICEFRVVHAYFTQQT